MTFGVDVDQGDRTPIECMDIGRSKDEERIALDNLLDTIAVVTLA